jgi:aspartate racemase
MARGRKCIGIIAGSGPEAGIDLWQKILDANRDALGPAFRGDLDAPDMVIVSQSRLGLSMDLEARSDEVWSCLEGCVREIAERTDYFAIACNTLHHYAPRIAALSLPAPLVSIVDVVARYLGRLDGTPATLLGSASVMGLGVHSPYAALARRFAVDAPAALVDEVHALIHAVKRSGGNSPAIVRKFRSILARIHTPVAILACTELPLIPVRTKRLRLVDANRLLATELVRRLGKPARD